MSMPIFGKQCPWCGNSTYVAYLGKRPSTRKLQWFEFSKHVSVCPHCAHAVKFSSVHQWWYALAVPMVVAILVNVWSFTTRAKSELISSNVIYASMFVGFIGLLAYSATVRLEKSDE